MKEEIIQFAREKPDMFAAILATWIVDEKGRYGIQKAVIILTTISCMKSNKGISGSQDGAEFSDMLEENIYENLHDDRFRRCSRGYRF